MPPKGRHKGGGKRNLHLVFRGRWTIARGPSHPFRGREESCKHIQAMWGQLATGPHHTTHTPTMKAAVEARQAPEQRTEGRASLSLPWWTSGLGRQEDGWSTSVSRKIDLQLASHSVTSARTAQLQTNTPEFCGYMQATERARLIFKVLQVQWAVTKRAQAALFFFFIR
eukprot:scaffold15242_cov138-Isochrysis_galbana.AAC.4